MTLQIRKTEPSDAKAIRDLFVPKSVYKQTLQLPYPALDMWAQRLSNIPNHVHSYVAVINDENSEDNNAQNNEHIVGNLALMLSTQDRQRHSASLGMAVKEGFQGQGIGSALMSTAIDLADNWLNLHRLELTVYTDNEPAIGLYKKFGFEIEGEARDFAFRDGAYVNAYYMARIKKFIS